MSDSITYYGREISISLITLLLSSTAWLFVFYLNSPGRGEIITHEDVVSIISQSSPYDARERGILDSRFTQLSNEIGRVLQIVERYQEKDDAYEHRIEAELVALRVQVERISACLGKKKE